MIVIYTYRHEHVCSRQNEELHIHPECDNGVEYERIPRCIEANVALVLVSRQVLGD